ncbi:MAG: quaternary ammonium compound efflux SMR transporter SugE [Sphingobacteriia bacterium]|nr:quaternary ammonium compound efflux SMR transporter SugE [Sphingobacteriia bacterium]
MTVAWIYLVIAGLLEICWAIGLKYSEGFSRFWPSIFTFVTLAGSMYLLSKSAQTLPIGTAYAVWVGIGALGAAVCGIILFNESVSLLRILFLAMLCISIIGLKFTNFSS